MAWFLLDNRPYQKSSKTWHNWTIGKNLVAIFPQDNKLCVNFLPKAKYPDGELWQHYFPSHKEAISFAEKHAIELWGEDGRFE